MTDKIRVLYVDDEPSLLDLTREFLELNGEFNVDTATSAREALESSSINSYDLIISDYQMPDMDGIVFLKAARERFGDIPFILFTGRGREEIVIEAINQGADFYLQKGGDVAAQFAELAHKIRQAVKRRTTEQDLRRSEARLRSFFETTREAVNLVDEEGKVIEWNAATERITGISKEEALGSYVWDLTYRMLPHQQHSEERRALIEQRIRDSLRTGIPVFEEPRVIESEGPDGSRIYTRQTIFPVKTDIGFGIGSISQDITKEKLAENALRESEKKYRDLAELLPQMVFELDLNFRVTWANQHAIATMGYTSQDIDQGIDARSFIVPTDLETAKDDVQKFKSGMPLGAREFTAVRKDKSTFPIVVYSAPVYRNEILCGFRGVAVDISDRKKMEDALRVSEEKFRGMAERSSDLILVLNKAMSPIYVSPSAQQILGFAPEELVGKTPEFAMATIFSETGPALMEAVQETMSGHRVESVELRLSRKDKTPVIVSTLAVPILRDGTLEGVQVSMRDITRQVVTQSALQAIVGSMAGTTGLDSLQKIAGNLSAWLEADCVMVGEIQPDHDTVKVLSMILDGKQVNDFSYHLKGTPCENVREKGFCHYPDDAIRLFPHSKDLADLNIRGYAGTPLKNSKGAVIGILCALFRRPFPSSQPVQEIMETIATKAGAEIERSQMERVLRQSEEKFRSFVENANEIIFSLTPVGVFTYVSPNWTEWLGHNTRDVIGRPASDFIHPDDFPQNREVFLQTLATGDRSSGAEFRVRHKDGSWQWYSQSISPIRDTKGTIIGIQGISHDITGRKRAEDELKKSQYLLMEALKMARMAEWEFDVPTGTFTFNDQFYALYGTTAEREGGYQMPAETYAREFTHPDDRDGVSQVIGQALSAPDSGDFSGWEHRIIRRDGEVRWIAVRIRATKDAEGRAVSTHGANQDITDRKMAEAEVKKSQYLLAEALDMAHMADWEFDIRTGVFTFNDQFYSLYGTTAEREGGYQMPGEVYVKEFIHMEDWHRVSDELEKVLASPDFGYFTLQEHRMIRRDGNVRWITVRVRVTRDSEGRAVSTHGANQDITDRKMAEDALRQANNKLNLLSGITRHDINNQLMALNGFVTLLQKNLRDSPHEKYISRITNSSRNIDNMIQFTKEYERIGTEALAWQDLTAVITAAGKGVIPPEITLVNELPAGTEIFGDPMLEKVFFNLIDNAVRHGEHVTQIRVSSRPSGDSLVIVWEDNGVGIPANEKERIFERGFGKNTGLGMFLVREILALKGISIVENGEPGRGARFEMTVPKGTYRFPALPV